MVSCLSCFFRCMEWTDVRGSTKSYGKDYWAQSVENKSLFFRHKAKGYERFVKRCNFTSPAGSTSFEWRIPSALPDGYNMNGEAPIYNQQKGDALLFPQSLKRSTVTTCQYREASIKYITSEQDYAHSDFFCATCRVKKISQLMMPSGLIRALRA